MKQFIEQGTIRICAAIQDLRANVDFEILSVPGGSVIAVLLSLYAVTMGYIRRAAIMPGVPPNYTSTGGAITGSAW